MANPATIKAEWLVIDAANQPLGRLASQVATLLRGKHKPSYTPHMDCGDNVIVINAERIRLTGSKMTATEVKDYSGYPGGLKIRSPREVLAGPNPGELVERAVLRMLNNKSRLGRAMYRKLHVFAGPDHKMEAQQPKPYTLKY
jgi:large subunit ribosomal protein L13